MYRGRHQEGTRARPNVDPRDDCRPSRPNTGTVQYPCLRPEANVWTFCAERQGVASVLQLKEWRQYNRGVLVRGRRQTDPIDILSYLKSTLAFLESVEPQLLLFPISLETQAQLYDRASMLRRLTISLIQYRSRER